MWPMLLLGAVQAGSQIYSGYKQKQAADQNAELMREQASFQRDVAYDQASQIRKGGESYKGSQVANIAASGVKTTSGSPLMALRETERNIQKDVSRTKQAGDHAYQSGMNQASALQQQGRDAFTSSLIGGATSFAGTLADNIDIPKSTTDTALSPVQKTAINNSDINYADFNKSLGNTPRSADSFIDPNFKFYQSKNPYGDYDWKKYSLYGYMGVK